MDSKVPHANCNACPLRQSKIVHSDPIREDARVVIVGESPGRTEVLKGEGFVGESGKLLWWLLGRHKITREQTNVTNAVLCEPPAWVDEKQAVMESAAHCCAPRLKHWLAETKGDILLLGQVAREVMMGPQGNQDFDTLHGRWQQVEGRNVLATYHPAYVLRTPDDAKTMFDEVKKFLNTSQNNFGKPTLDIVTEDNMWDILSYVLSTGVTISYDIETEQVDPRVNKILALGIAITKTHAYIFPGLLLYKTSRDPRWQKFWESSNRFVGQNAKFDRKFMRMHLGWKIRNDFDTMLAHFLIDERKGTHGLKALAAQFLDVPDYEADILQFLKSRNDNYGKIPFDNLSQYLAYDVCVVIALVPILEALLLNEGLHPLFKDTMALENVLHKAEIIGMKVDVDYANEHLQVFDDELNAMHEEIKQVSGYPIDNLNSHKQVGVMLFDHLGLPKPRGRKIKEGSTNKEALLQLSNTHPVVGIIQKYRRVAKMRSSYLANVLEMLDDDDVVHCDFQIHGTETGRLSVHSPALQTIPRADEREDGKYGKIIKDMYITRPGRVFVIADYSQAELRIAAALSGDEFLLQVYRDGRDLHSEVARAMYGENFTKTQRVNCKMFNFSYLYGGNEYSFALDAGIPIDIAREFVARYDSVMPRLKTWKNEQEHMIRTKGYVIQRSGRRRRIPLINMVNSDDARKASFNSVVQGAASELTSVAAIAIDKQLDGRGGIVLLVHDSNVCEVNIGYEHEVGRLMQTIMINAGTQVFPEVVWQVDVEVGERWGSTKPLQLN